MTGSAASSPNPASTPPAKSGFVSIVGWWRNVPIEAVLVGLGLFALLALLVAADPPTNATLSNAPFTDEGFNLVNSRNLVQLGQWSTDDWTRHLVELPFAILEAATFRLIGVGIVQARLVMILCVSLTAAALVWGLRDSVGRACAVFAGLAFAGSGLILLYGRLVFFEDLVVLGLTLGTLVLVRDSRLNLRWGMAAGMCYAIAIGTKPNAAFAVVGILAALGLVWGWRDRGLRRWVFGAGLVICLSGLLWVLVIWLPNRSAVAIDLSTWPPLDFNLTPRAFVRSVGLYLQIENDGVLGSLLGPLVALAAAGTVAIVTFRSRLTRVQARLTVAAFGWAALSFGILLVVSYRPNRYAVPIVPSLAILAAIGLHVGEQWLVERLRRRRLLANQPDRHRSADEAETAGTANPSRLNSPGILERRATSLLAIAAIVVAVAPGLRLYGTWAGGATHNLVAIQSQFANVVPAGERVAGRDVALFFMRSEAVTTVVAFTNQGNLYAEGVRLYLVLAGDPVPNGVPSSSWAARQPIACANWNATTECLVRVP